jgi:hypothetical protein
MPYQIRQAGENYEVVNTDTGEVKAVHTPPNAKQKAEAQLRLLRGVEQDGLWEPSDAR